MSVLVIRSLLETRLKAIDTTFPTAWENVAFTPPNPSDPYQAAFVIFATPDNPETGSGFRELGYFQVNLIYPLNSGSKASATKALQIRNSFPKNLSLSSGAVVVMINKTPEITRGQVVDNQWQVTIKIPFYSNAFA